MSLPGLRPWSLAAFTRLTRSDSGMVRYKVPDSSGMSSLISSMTAKGSFACTQNLRKPWRMRLGLRVDGAGGVGDDKLLIANNLFPAFFQGLVDVVFKILINLRKVPAEVDLIIVNENKLVAGDARRATTEPEGRTRDWCRRRDC